MESAAYAPLHWAFTQRTTAQQDFTSATALPLWMPWKEMIDITSAAVKDPKVLVLSTVFTANHHAYKEALVGKEVIEVGFEHLASLIEAQASKEEICKELDSKLSSYYHSGIPAVLACTHYPLVEDEIKDYLQAKTYDSVDPVLSLDIYTKGKGKVEVFASKDPEKFDEKVADIFHEEIHTGKAE